jgi:hypothetical protein
MHCAFTRSLLAARGADSSSSSSSSSRISCPGRHPNAVVAGAAANAGLQQDCSLGQLLPRPVCKHWSAVTLPQLERYLGVVWMWGTHSVQTEHAPCSPLWHPPLHGSPLTHQLSPLTAALQPRLFFFGGIREWVNRVVWHCPSPGCVCRQQQATKQQVGGIILVAAALCRATIAAFMCSASSPAQ